MLQHVAQLLDRSTRPQDVAARYGGEEFVVILRDRMLYQAKENGRDRVEADLQRA